jgi:SAM-dependent methyltransferase
MRRQDIALSAIERKGRGLEIGPSLHPLAPKAEGFDVDIVDHLDQSGLIAKYTPHGLDVSRIEPVDFVWQDGRLLDAVKKVDHYDYIIAAHVLEHLPDPLGFLADSEVLLKPGGVLALVIPDKRYCFDYFNTVTTTGALLDAAWQPRARHTPGAVVDHLALAARLDEVGAWRTGSTGTIAFMHEFAEAATVLERVVRDPDTYHDIHRWYFTPSSFKLIALDLLMLGRTRLVVAAEHDTVGHEFYVSLRKVDRPEPPPDWQAHRLRLARNVVTEQFAAVVAEDSWATSIVKRLRRLARRVLGPASRPR